MERVGVLVNKLHDQLQQQTEAHKMLITAQMLYTELLSETQNGAGYSTSKVSVVVPSNPPLYTPGNAEAGTKKLAPVAPVDEQPKQFEIQKGPVVESLKDVASTFVYDQPSNVQSVTLNSSASTKPSIPQQEKVVYELNEEIGTEESMNEKLKEEKTELGAVLHNVPIRDLKKAISINDRHRFIEALFRGDETMYERSIKTINNFSIFAEAEFWMQRELKLKLGWDLNLPEVRLFDHLVSRRFS